MFVSQIGVGNLAQMTVARAVSLLEQHYLHRLPTTQARKDWREEMALPFRFDPDNKVYLAMVSSGAAVDMVDAHDIINTEMLCQRQPHREKALRRALNERRVPKMNAALMQRLAARETVEGPSNQADVGSEAGSPSQ